MNEFIVKYQVNKFYLFFFFLVFLDDKQKKSLNLTIFIYIKMLNELFYSAVKTF